MDCTVLRPFRARGEDLRQGQVIDTSDWRQTNVQGLIAGRYLRPAHLEAPAGFQVQLTRASGRPRKEKSDG